MRSGRGIQLAIVTTLVGAALIPATAVGDGPTVIHARSFGLSTPARNLDGTSGPSGPVPSRINPAPSAQGTAGPDADSGGPAAGSPATRGVSAARAPAPGLVFDGTSNPFACGTCTPPDTNGDAGPNNYIQIVNATKVAIYNKSGTLLQPAFDLSTLFPPGPCNSGNDGDPIALYDSIADRWLLAQFRDTGVSTHLCFAISQTPNPQGAYFTYDFVTAEFPDYFKVGVWPNGYYVGSNETTYAAYAFDRTKMLAGDPSAAGVRFTGQDNFLMPADVDGIRTPASTDGGLFYTFKDDVFHGGADRLELFQLTPDFASPGSSIFTQIGSFPITPFIYTVCGFFDLSCIPQSGTAQMVDAVSEWPMFRLAYRRFGDHQALVGNFTVGGGSASADGLGPGTGAQIRWFELRNTSGPWSLFQEGTFDPGGGLNRFMGSISIDVEGNIALGYSASSGTAFPSIRYATRAPGDPAGTLGAEQVLKAGGGSQTSTGDRWGDYSAMAIDPADGCTFWYTNQYYSVTSTNSWQTAIGNFKVPSCADTDGDGIANNTDQCPTTFSLEASGCPSNAFTLGKKKLNKKKGTATIKVSVPGPGELRLKGKNVKSQRGSRTSPARALKPVNAAGTVKLKVTPKGKAKKKLKKKGKVKVRPSITYTPSGGLPNTQTTKLKLKKKRKK